MMELVFEAKPKKIKVKVSGSEYEMRVPRISESEALQDSVVKADPKDVKGIYTDFFVSLGLTKDALDSFDVLDFQEFIGFVLFPKKN
jgi:hypothetical protein